VLTLWDGKPLKLNTEWERGGWGSCTCVIELYTIDEIKNGLTTFCDCLLMTELHFWKKWIQKFSNELMHPLLWTWWSKDMMAIMVSYSSLLWRMCSVYADLGLLDMRYFPYILCQHHCTWYILVSYWQLLHLHATIYNFICQYILTPSYKHTYFFIYFISGWWHTV
jgi:hypothetical protein